MELFEFASSRKKKTKLQVDGGSSCLAAKQLSSVHVTFYHRRLSQLQNTELIFPYRLMADVSRTLEEQDIPGSYLYLLASNCLSSQVYTLKTIIQTIPLSL